MKKIFILYFAFLTLTSLLSGETMTTKKIAPYGTWNSPVTAEKIAEGANVKQNMLIDKGSTYYTETRPSNKGRSTIVRRDPSGAFQDMTPPDFNVRSFVHEYGGGAFTVKNGIIYASSGSDSALYVFQPGQPPKKLTEGQKKSGQNDSLEGTRFADFVVILRDGEIFHFDNDSAPQHLSKGLIAVGEHHQPGKPVENFLAFIDLKTGNYRKIAHGKDFYSSPAISPDEKKIAWISWNHPNMPWTNTELWLADISNDGSLTNQKQIAGHFPESIFQPQWSPDGTLYFSSDRSSGWWNIHRYNAHGVIENVLPMEAEVGEPLWTFGKSAYAFLGNHLVFAYNSNGIWGLGLLDLEKKTMAQPGK